ncbi:hypothetical protein niasHT_012620 [Heterodera trifolii]|uniref:SAM-dependent methyltransferase RsmB-F/NOP2-type catalytic core domain-containing protein n=1 Tax=Heterodera trifolii TaxID=157864 RepID=A0ABD2L1G5_9BILA
MLSSDAPGELHAQGTTPRFVIAGALASKVELPPGNRTTEMILRSTVSRKEGIGWEQVTKMYHKFLQILRFRPALFEQRAAKSGAPRFKPRMARVKPLRTPTMLALDNFDFYYGPIFGDKWPSVRLALLSRKKFVAVANRFSANFESNKEILKSLGTINLMEDQMKIGEQMTNRIEQMKRKLDKKAAQSANEEEEDEEESHSVGDGDEDQQQFDDDSDDIASRLGDGLAQFQPSANEIVLGTKEVKRSKRSKGWDKGAYEMLNTKRVIYDSSFNVTGLEGVDEPLPTVEDVLLYPRELALFSHPRMCIDGFPEPLKDRNNISSQFGQLLTNHSFLSPFLGWWLLDGGSALPVLALDLRDDDVVLDMCASPGGKSLMILQTGKFASLVCNDSSLFRLGELRRALALHVPAKSEVSSQVILKRKDAASVESWTETEVYDKLQTRMMVNALRSVRVGGSVVYSTCTLSPTQNEMVVENACALARTHYGIKAVERSLKKMENRLTNTGLFQFSADCRRGSLLLPSLLSNFGPTYVCKITRIG